MHSTPKRIAVHSVIIGILVVVIISIAFTLARKKALQASSRRHMMQIAFALRCYYDDYGCLPPAYIVDNNGKRTHSWRVLLLPSIEGLEGRYSQYDFNQSWNSTTNRCLAMPMPTTYRLPDDVNPEKTVTHYVAVVGANTIWSGRESDKSGPLEHNSDKILLVEFPESDIHWMEPRDLTLKEMLDLIQLKKDTSNSSINYVEVSGRPCTLDCNIDRKSLLKLLLRAPNKNVIGQQQKTPSGTSHNSEKSPTEK